MKVILTQVQEGHPDFQLLGTIRDEIAAKVGGLASLQIKFPELVRGAIDFVLDPVRTARTNVKDLDNVEKTFIGLKLEHFVRDMLDVPKGLRDLEICGIDVDIKNTVGDNWSIPQETYDSSEPCLLMSINDKEYTCSLGLIIAKIDYLHGGKGNRDTKRGVSKLGRKNILWILINTPFPPSLFAGLDMDRFRNLRKSIKTANKRAAEFCRENLGRIIHREVVLALLFDQKDPMKRFRANKGVSDILEAEGIALLNGTYILDRRRAERLGVPRLMPDEWVALRFK